MPARCRKEEDAVLESFIMGTGAEITMWHLAVCTAVSAGLGLCLAAVHSYKNTSSRSFLMTLILLPVIVQVVIMLVNGNLGTGVAVMGAFSLVRFRSMPGSAREITSVFTAMAIGLADGMGYLGAAAFLTAAAAGITVLLNEQNARMALSIADRAYVLETGKITISGKAGELLQDERVKKAYLGQ